MINSDILEDVTLLNGGYPQRYGEPHRRGGRLPHARGIARSAAGARRRERHRARRPSSKDRSAAQARIVARVGAPDLPRSALEQLDRRATVQLRLHRRAGEARLRRLAVAARGGDACSPATRASIRRRPGRARPGRRARLNASVVGVARWRFTPCRDRPHASACSRRDNQFRNADDRGRRARQRPRTASSVAAPTPRASLRPRRSTLEAGGSAATTAAIAPPQLAPAGAALAQLDDYTGDGLGSALRVGAVDAVAP